MSGGSGNGWLVSRAPPTLSRASSTTTRAPDFAKYAAETRPLWPPPTTITSYGSAATRLCRSGGRPAQVGLDDGRILGDRSREADGDRLTLVEHLDPVAELHDEPEIVIDD